MSTFSTFFAATALDEALASWRSMNAALREGISVFAALGLVTLLVLVWAVVLRKTGRKRHSRRHGHQQGQESATPQAVRNGGSAAVTPEKGRKWRRRRRERRPRNPTLAETGGLPPVRIEEQTESPP